MMYLVMLEASSNSACYESEAGLQKMKYENILTKSNLTKLKCIQNLKIKLILIKQLPMMQYSATRLKSMQNLN